jgi:formylglycine-generating enzyme required for sulfatase activity
MAQHWAETPTPRERLALFKPTWKDAIRRNLWCVAALAGLAAIGCSRTVEQPAAETPAKARADARRADARRTDAGPAGGERIVTTSGIEMLRLPGGEFTLGDDQGEEDEKPAHRVRLSPFWIDANEVSQAVFQKLMGRNPSKSVGPDKPVERISWHVAIQFCNMRSRKEGFRPCYDLKTSRCDFAADGYRLPTEAEWEYACRAGTATRWSFGDDDAGLANYGWFKGNAAKTTHPIRQKRPNPWGLYDMHGNVAEWCNDFYRDHYDPADRNDPQGPAAGEERVLRGGSWNGGAESCRSAARSGAPPGLADVCFGYEAYGFRCVRRSAGPAR